MKKMIAVSILLFAIPAMSLANCGNDNGNGNGCSGDGTVGSQGPTGATGPQGSQGTPGVNGSNGTNGTNGANGSTGVAGAAGKNGAQGPIGSSAVDPRMTEARLGIDTAVRLYDSKRFQLQVYNIYSPSLHSSEDVVGDGRNLQFGVRMIFKLGTSYEERQNNSLKAQLESLQLLIARMAQ